MAVKQEGISMVDMLIKLYDLEINAALVADKETLGVELRKPIGPEKHAVIAWVQNQFSAGWASEVDVALSNQPRTCFIAVREGKIIGFACYDATALGFFGPIGVAESHRGKGTGRALMDACLLDMRQRGYGYAIAGGVKDTEFYRHSVNAIEIPDSEPGIYAGRI
jgi:GNAT superfamily N-acetyltransferase